ncbi:MAG: DUF1559 domain-containing protein [Planctomycetota bacterium]
MNRPPKNIRIRYAAGLTLVELLVVIAIIGVLVSLLLPAVQAARESARRTQCQNNVRQIALSVLNYADTHDGNLPALWQTDEINPWENFGWRVDVLPFIESSPLYDSLETTQPPLATINRQAIRTVLPYFQCPSTPSALRSLPSIGWENDVDAGACDYSAIHDVSNDFSETPLPGAWRSKATSEAIEGTDAAGTPQFTEVDRTNPQLRTKYGKLKMIEDGLANTALLVEQAGKPMLYDENRIGEEIDPPGEGAWATADFSSFYASGINRDNLKGIYSFHGGAIVAMCDASVHYFSADMEVEVVTALLSRNGDEIINANDWR